ncbi:LuxR C-terminal-related transcriptional regulator [Agrobacterium sp. rho-13.3]|uniref:LuxR C-terminal-related transcriptional regulator n=1 Tax=Agrobacterium sp. rho-13.3 TaxID=3072980 RepID=UPI002A0CA8A0|nr:LuxR C-terminal-related transcriptional regulator [Agrobacterium sp. rho-13.3]MDX8306230.1 LuxR C-terminal-related transcriptional regulator [Agrobacterium sp. rho-13.3]MDX8307439.1 LuxR C-terminal-related transcriptional regulator [Agrobacterium sp. rho-13.3]
MKSFATCVHDLMDAWITSREGAQATDIYQAVMGPTQPNVVLAVVDCRDSEIGTFSVDFIHRYSIATTAFDFLKLQWQEPLDLRSFLDQKYLRDSVIPALSRVMNGRRPSLSKGNTACGGCKIFYEMLLIPQKNAIQQCEWCILFSKIDLVLPAALQQFQADGIDLSILQLLTEGAFQKEIGARLKLSPRTIEHRIERLKERVGAKNLHHLVALWISVRV